MKSILKISAIASALFSPTLIQAQATSPMEVSATVDAGCFIEADNINFGVLQMPLSDNTASANLRVHCSKGVLLNLHVAYDNQSLTSGTYTSQVVYFTSNSGSQMSHRIYNNGSPISSETTNYKNFNFDIICGINRVAFYSNEVLDLFSIDRNIGFNAWRDDIWGICSKTSVNQTKLSSISSLSNGNLTGIVSQEVIQYYLSVPESSAKWNQNNKYQIVSTGSSQTIPMQAHIKSNENPTHRMTNDNYQSTLNVVLSY